MNLGWKLALACKDKGSDLLLESYAIERRQHVLQTTMFVLRATPNPSVMKIITSRVFYNLLYRPIIRAAWYHHNSGTHSTNHFSQSGIQLGIKLNFSPVVMKEETIQPDDPTCKYNPTICAGARIPYLPLLDRNGIFSFIDSSGYSILVINTDLLDFANQLAISITDSDVPATVSIIPRIDVNSFKGHYKKIAQLFLAESVLVVRPDHIIAWRACSTNTSIGNAVEQAIKNYGP